MSKYDSRRAGMDCIYGFFPGGDPRLFEPDRDSCTPEEVANWTAACDEWDRREAAGVDRIDGGEPGSCVHGPGFQLLVPRLGIGVYWFEDIEA